MNENQNAYFTEQLLKWFEHHHRPLPWKGEKNPYFIWLSEIILQQTRVEQGLPYFLKFKEHFPTIQDLAAASEDEVMLLWQGLGYYSRARNLHTTAKYITHTLDGVFPNTYKGILELKGVGTYTAAAIASFAYDLPYAVVDGNVYRVLSRYFGIETPIDTTAGKKEFAALAEALIDKNAPADYNQAIMDFGATHCTPSNPNCESCLLRSKCKGFNTQKNDILPVKIKKIKKKERFFNFLVIKNGDFLYLQKRTEKDIWQNLYQFVLIETEQLIDGTALRALNHWQDTLGDSSIESIVISNKYKQILTHQKIWGIFYEIAIEEKLDEERIQKLSLIPVQKSDLEKFAFPKIIDLFLKDKTLSLKLF